MDRQLKSITMEFNLTVTESTTPLNGSGGMNFSLYTNSVMGGMEGGGGAGGLPTEINHKACVLYKFVVYTVFLGCLCILGVIGNLVAYVVFWKDTIKTSTTFLFQGLSMIDTVLLLTAFPIYVIQPLVEYMDVLQSFQYIQPYILVYILPCTFTAQTATIWVTVLVGFNRYVAVCKPYQASRLCNISMARKYLLIVLCLSFLYNIPRFAASKINYELGPNNETIAIPSYTEMGKNPLYLIIYNNILYLIFLLILPLLTLTILNVRLINALKEIKRRRMEMQSLRQQQDNNVTFVLIIVVLVFTVCQLPALVNQLLWNILSDGHRICGGFQYYFSCLSNLLVIINSAINFLIYFLFNKRFRTVFLETVCKGKLGPYDKKPGRNGNLKGLETTQTLL